MRPGPGPVQPASPSDSYGESLGTTQGRGFRGAPMGVTMIIEAPLILILYRARTGPAVRPALQLYGDDAWRPRPGF